MNILDQIKLEWEQSGLEHKPYKSAREIEIEYNNNLMLAARIEDKLGRKLSDQEIFDLTM